MMESDFAYLALLLETGRLRGNADDGGPLDLYPGVDAASIATLPPDSTDQPEMPPVEGEAPSTALVAMRLCPGCKVMTAVLACNAWATCTHCGHLFLAPV